MDQISEALVRSEYDLNRAWRQMTEDVKKLHGLRASLADSSKEDVPESAIAAMFQVCEMK